VAAAAACLAAGWLAACGGAGEPDAGGPLVPIGEAVIAPQPEVEGDPEIGGLSSLFHVGGGLYYAVSDDRGVRGPARYYTIHIPLTGGRLNGEQVSVLNWDELRDAGGEPLAPLTFDLEGLVAHGNSIFVASEGDVEAGVPPFIAVFDAESRLVERLGLPPLFLPAGGGAIGVRDNLAFESLTIDPSGRYLFTATESALAQDGPIATTEHGATARILRFDRERGVFDAQYLYPVEPIHAAAALPGGVQDNGLVELVALSDRSLLALERSFAAGAAVEQSIRLFEVCLEGADDIATIPGLAAVETASIRPARKRLIADIAELVDDPDNVEGFSLGPRLRTGEPTLLFVSDNNFDPVRQTTKILAFRIEPGAITGCEGVGGGPGEELALEDALLEHPSR